MSHKTRLVPRAMSGTRTAAAPPLPCRVPRPSSRSPRSPAPRTAGAPAGTVGRGLGSRPCTASGVDRRPQARVPGGQLLLQGPRLGSPRAVGGGWLCAQGVPWVLEQRPNQIKQNCASRRRAELRTPWPRTEWVLEFPPSHGLGTLAGRPNTKGPLGDTAGKVASWSAACAGRRWLLLLLLPSWWRPGCQPWRDVPSQAAAGPDKGLTDTRTNRTLWGHRPPTQCPRNALQTRTRQPPSAQGVRLSGPTGPPLLLDGGL